METMLAATVQCSRVVRVENQPGCSPSSKSRISSSSSVAGAAGLDARVVLRILATQDAIGTQAFSRDSGVGVEARPQRRGIGATTGAADDSIVFRAKQRKRRTGGA